MGSCMTPSMETLAPTMIIRMVHSPCLGDVPPDPDPRRSPYVLRPSRNASIGADLGEDEVLAAPGVDVRRLPASVGEVPVGTPGARLTPSTRTNSVTISCPTACFLSVIPGS